MKRKSYTFFVVSNQEGQTKKIVISAAKVKVVAFILSIVILVLTTGLIDYFGLLVQALENKKLKSENAQLLKQFQVVETKVSSLENSLERVKSFTAKLKLITNVDAEDRIAKLTMGRKPVNGNKYGEDYEPMDQRLSPKKLMEQDKILAPEPEVDEQQGEVTVQDSDRDYASLVVRIDKAVKETQLKEQSVIELWEGLSERQSLLNSTPNIKPTRGWITSNFGYRVNPFTGKNTMHAGIDIAAAPGSPVYAPADGLVVYASYDQGYGKLVSIDHGYGVTTRFGHNSQIYVHVGQRVSKWDVISAVGNTGRSTGPHLHYEVRINNVPVDPINFILDE
ncbi:MAG: M23 family metallopeptidase [Bdellovibrionales bacterium]|nr:M23 family metallopeptidase [Bdellovibrionales bacterium]